MDPILAEDVSDAYLKIIDEAMQYSGHGAPEGS